MGSLIRGSASDELPRTRVEARRRCRATAAGAGRDPAAPGDFDRFVSSAAAAAVVADAAEALDCPDFGMRLAREQGIQILGPVAVIIRNAETFASALDGVSRYCITSRPRSRRACPRAASGGAHPHDHRASHWAPRPMGREGSRLGDGRLPPAARRGLRPPEGDHATPAYRNASKLPGHVPVSTGVRVGSELRSTAQPRTRAADPRSGCGRAGACARSTSPTSVPISRCPITSRDLTRRLLVVNHASLAQAARAMSVHPRILQRRLAESGTRSRRSLTTYAVNSPGSCPPAVSRSLRSRPCSGTPSRAATPGHAGAGTANRRGTAGASERPDA